ncbi:MAG: GntR family transcriptional regulator [Gammaproteobacteria bacterium]|nr:GntR family transcriptional regulator [Gammaproteobacteria bacterium]
MAPTRLSGPVYERLKELILSGRIAPGVKLDEEMLSRRFGVSRTPVREAVSKLAHEGLVQARPRRGAYVTNCSKTEILELLEVREVLEGLVARLAAHRMSDASVNALRELINPERVETLRTTEPAALARADQQFHEALFRSTGNRRLIAIMSQLNDQMQLVRMKTMWLPGRLDQAMRETYDIIDALARRDPDLAEACARRHIRAAHDMVEKSMDEAVWPVSEHEGGI